MSVPLVDIRPGAGMPAKMVADSISRSTHNTHCTVHQRVLENLNIRTVDYVNSLVTIDKHVSGTYCSFGYFKEESVIARPEPIVVKTPCHTAYILDSVINKPAVNITYVIPYTVRIRMVDNEIVLTRNAVTLIEYLYPRGIISGNILDIVTGKNVFFKQNIG